MDDTLKRIGEFVSRNDPVAAEDFFQYNRGNKDRDANRWLRGEIRRMIGQGVEVEKLYDLLKRTYLLTAQENFEDYMIYLEWDRPIKERFYVPRQRVMAKVVAHLQAFADNELDELFLSMPARVGKTSLMLFYMTWLIGRDSEKSNLYSAYSDTITKAFYNGVLEIINDPTTYLLSLIHI